MGALQKALDDELARLPHHAMEQIVREKLAAISVQDEDLVRRIIEDAISDGGETNVGEDDGASVDIVFTAEDAERLKRASSEFLKELPNFVRKLISQTGDDIAVDFRRQSNDRKSTEGSEASNLVRRMRTRWGIPLSDLRLLIELCRQQGDEFNKAHIRSTLKRNAERNEVLAWLHIRACRVADEIMLLIENAHLEGAEARWRTLFEVSVVATLIAEGGDDLAERFLAHEVIERKKLLDDYVRSARLLGERLPAKHEIDVIEKEVAAAVRRYGKAFRGGYGWAAGQLGLSPNPQFCDLQEMAGALSSKFQYRLACAGVHASPRTLKQPLHYWDPTLHIPGLFDASIEKPVGETAQVVVLITSLLVPEPWDLDKLAFLHALVRLRDDIRSELHKTVRRMEREEARSRERAIRSAERRLPRPRFR